VSGAFRSRWLPALLIVMVLSACAAKQVRCDGHLVPINAAHPKPVVEAPK